MVLKRGILFLVVAIVLGGCASVGYLRPGSHGAPVEFRVLEKNYEIGEIRSVYVGEPLIRQRDYYQVSKPIDKIRATNNFTIHNIPSIPWAPWTVPWTAAIGTADETYTIIGTVTHDGNNYNVFRIDSSPEWGFAVSDDGVLLKNPLSLRNNLLLPMEMYRIEPESTRFIRSTETAIDTKRGYINYEIIYTGLNDKSVNLLYREYPPEDIAKPASYQNLTYPLNSNILRFRKIRIELKKATDQQITFAVLEDNE